MIATIDDALFGASKAFSAPERSSNRTRASQGEYVSSNPMYWHGRLSVRRGIRLGAGAVCACRITLSATTPAGFPAGDV